MVSPDVPPPSFVVAADGTRLATYRWPAEQPEGDGGEAARRPVVLLVHGFASSATANFAVTGWVRDLTRAGFDVVALDQRGHGASDSPDDPSRYGLPLLVDDVLAVLDAHDLDAVHYVGYSLGARVGWQTAVRAPERVLAAVLGGIPDGEPLARFDVPAARAHLETGAEVADRITAAYLTMADSVAGNDVRALVSLVEGMRGSGEPDADHPPQQPVLFATGSEDRILDRSRTLASAVPAGAFFEIPGRHHFNAPTSRHFRTAAIDFLTDAADDAPAPRRDLPPELARSWLLVPALGTDLAAAAASGADALVLDLEDSVDETRKDAAREAAVAWLAGGGRGWVRVNGRATSHWPRDVDALRGVAGLVGVVLSKTEAATEVTETSDRLGGDVPVVALVESAVGVEEAVAVARARGCARLAFGSADYRLDTGTGDTEVAMGYPRSRLVVASRVGGLPGPVDGPTTSSSRPALREDCETAVQLGLTGKLCAAPEQVGVVNEALSPTPTDVAWARTFLADFAARDRVVRDAGDLPRLGRAERIERLAAAYGVAPG
ncbi:citrate lyase beta subunit [Pseudokineococcus lusitanus]|uniref:Citrate lyase beta subunit n=1 Tax=Pseudokineococcus lusitanus TaxID=763993 RepID=A0A3N1GAB3_9ACTN|nr:alpha/beta fold hydrolase [Pseudokineococcus lusitanus]ROP27180.1 citrate lyase beta subunit [Pseudokineococcus lusitanus]